MTYDKKEVTDNWLRWYVLKYVIIDKTENY